jgi:hypothetical protein
MFEHLEHETVEAYRQAWRREQQENEEEARELITLLPPIETPYCFAVRHGEAENAAAYEQLRQKVMMGIRNSLLSALTASVLLNALQKGEREAADITQTDPPPILDTLLVARQFLSDPQSLLFEVTSAEAKRLSAVHPSASLPPHKALRLAKYCLQGELFPPLSEQSIPEQNEAPLDHDRLHSPLASPTAGSGVSLKQADQTQKDN